MDVPVRIYADFNGLVRGIKNPDRLAVVLDTFGSVRDLANAGLVLREGLPIIAADASDDIEDLEGHGTAQYDPGHKWWVVEFDELGVRYVPAGDRESSEQFLCVRCRAPFPSSSPAAVLRSGSVCPGCGASPLLPIAAPPPAGT
jgi:hypothetical protein